MSTDLMLLLICLGSPSLKTTTQLTSFSGPAYLSFPHYCIFGVFFCFAPSPCGGSKDCTDLVFLVADNSYRHIF